MFDWLSRMFGGRSAVQRARGNPAVQEAVQHSAEVYGRILLRNFIGEERRNELARELFLEIHRICNTIDPVATCREALAAAMLDLAAYQVLVIPPEPEEDPTGLRAQPGVSGGLKEYLRVLCEKNDELRSTMFAEAGSDTLEVLWQVVQRHYWEARWRAGSLDALRITLGDFVEGDDWYQPFLHAACVKLEHDYRWELELPPAFPADIAKEAATVYSMFTDIVVSGAANPAKEWRDYCRSCGVPMPAFGP